MASSVQERLAGIQKFVGEASVLADGILKLTGNVEGSTIEHVVEVAVDECLRLFGAAAAALHVAKDEPITPENIASLLPDMTIKLRPPVVSTPPPSGENSATTADAPPAKPPGDAPAT